MNLPETQMPPAWEQDAAMEQEKSDLPILEYAQVLWYRKKLIIAITLFATVVGWIQVNQIRSIYTAKSMMMVGIPQSQVVDIEAVLTNNVFGDEIRGQIEIMRSRRLAERVVNDLGLHDYEEFNPRLRVPEERFFDFLKYLNPKTWIPQDWKNALKEAMGKETQLDPVTEPLGEEELEQQEISTAAGIFLGKVSIELLDFSNVIEVRYSSWSPELAARIANEIPEAYIVDQLEAKFEATEKANSWLTEQLEELETKVAESERAVEIFREEYGLVGSSGKGLLDAQLSELNSQLIVARAARAETEARLEQIRRLTTDQRQGVETMTEILNSPVIQQLRTQELEVLARMSELSVEFGPKHPRMIQVQAERAEIRERIGLEVKNVAAGLENEAEFARTRVQSLEVSLRAAQGDSSEQNKEAVQLRALEREAAANRALYETFLRRFKETSTTQDIQTAEARVISEAQVPGGPSYPNRQRQLMVYVLFGLIGSCGMVLGLHLLNPGMRTPEQVQQGLREYVIGVIPVLAEKEDIHDYVLRKPQSRVVEAINSLKFSLALSNPDIQVKAIQVTSSVPSEGKTSLALALARVEAASGKKVILVDGDLRRTSIVKKLGLKPGHKGLSDLVVAAEDHLPDFIMRDEEGKMDFMPTGTAKYTNAVDIFSSHRMEKIIEQLKEHYDLVVVDAPPVMAVSDARIIGRLVDKTVFVVRWNKTPVKVARVALDQLKRYGTDVAGVVIQQVDMDQQGYLGQGSSGYYYHYGRSGKYYSS